MLLSLSFFLLIHSSLLRHSSSILSLSPSLFLLLSLSIFRINIFSTSLLLICLFTIINSKHPEAVTNVREAGALRGEGKEF